MPAPIAPKRPYTHTEHGVQRSDPYHWMREREDPELLPYVNAENAHMEAGLAHLAPLRKALFDESLSRIQEDDAQPPVKDGPWESYTRTVAGAAYPVYCRQPRGGGAEQVLLDPNQMDHKYISIGAFEVSPDHSRLAYAIDTSGGEVYEAVVIDLASGEELGRLKEISGNIAWANDNQTLLYTIHDQAWRPFRLLRHRLGTPQDQDALLWEEEDTRFRLSIARTRSNRFLVCGVHASTTGEVRVLDAEDPSELRMLIPRKEGREIDVSHQGERWLIHTNGEKVDGVQQYLEFALFQAPLDAPMDWQPLVPHRADVQLLGASAFEHHIVLSERSGGLKTLRILDQKTGADWTLPMEQDPALQWMGSNPEWGQRTLRYGTSSLITPGQLLEVDLDTRVQTLLKETPVPNYTAANYRSERRWVTAPDGAEIPVAMCWHKDTKLQDAPTLLYGYGSYGVVIDPHFSTARPSLLDRGVVYAIAQVRGGGAKGRAWYEDGKLKNKQNSFGDFIAVARKLIADGVTSPGKLVIQGGSAGGLLMGATVNQAPELFAACIAQVPFVDVVSTMLDESIPLTTNEWEEWGNPAIREPFDWMLAYSPYDQVCAQDYPAMLVISGLNDPRVQYWEPTKWVAKLRAVGTGGAPIWLKTHMGAGHAGQSGRYGRLDDAAFVNAFALHAMGAVKNP